MINAVDLRPGNVFTDSGTLYEVLRFQHHRMSQAAAICKVRVKDLRSGVIVDKSYRSADKFEAPEVEKKLKTFLYFDNDMANFMDMQTYETSAFNKEKLGWASQFLTENLEVEGLYVGDELMDIILPPSVNLKVETAPPGIRGDSATNPTKPCTLENGMVVQTPAFIKGGDIVSIDTDSGEYIGRV
ncbi:elongation factor P [Elusimicrobiota bacterium]